MKQFIEVETSLGQKSWKNWLNSTGNRNCRYCGKSHSHGNFPAFGKKCPEMWER